MIHKYLSHAWRAIEHNRRYMLISMVGLVLSLVGSIIIERYVYRELTVDHYLPQLDRTMVVYNYTKDYKQSTSMINFNNVDRFPTPQAGPGVDAYTRFYAFPDSYVSADGNERSMDVIVADSAFFDVLPRTIARGQLPTREFEAVITSKAAQLLWPDENPIGRSISLYSDQDAYTVVGVVDDMPTKGHFDYGVVLQRDVSDYMANTIGWMVLRMRDDASIDALKDYIGKQVSYMKELGQDPTHTFVDNIDVMPLADLYFDTSFSFLQQDSAMFPVGNMQNLRILEIVAALLLLVGLFNFLNIYSIVMITRGSAFAVRKTFGAGRGNILLHILCENFLVIAAAVLLAWAIIAGVSPLLTHYCEIEQVVSLKFDLALSAVIVVAFTLVISTAAATGIWCKARVHSMGNADSRHSVALRRYLLLLPQMAITLIMITVSVYFMRQLHHMLTADTGFATENILSFKLWPQQGRDKAHQRFNSEQEWLDYKQELQKQSATTTQAIAKIKEMPEALAVCSWNARFGKPSLLNSEGNTTPVKNAETPDNEWINCNVMFLTLECLDVFQIKLVEADSIALRGFSPEVSYNAYKMIADRQLLRQLGISGFRDGRVQTEHRLWWSMDGDMSANPPYEIIGVIDKLRTEPLYKDNLPTMILLENQADSPDAMPLIRYNPALKDQLLKRLTALYQELNGPGAEPEFVFTENITDQVYAKERRTATIYGAFAILAVLISCLGLYGVVAYDMQRRRREMMIRRVHGATRRDLAKLAARPYAATLCIAAVIAAAASLYAVTQYQSHYVDFVPMQPWGYLAGIAVIALIGYATIRTQIHTSFHQDYSHD